MPKSRKFYIVLFILTVILGLLPHRVEAAKGVSIQLKTLKPISVGNGASIYLYNSVVKSISPANKVKSVSVKPLDKGITVKRVNVRSSSGVVENRKITFVKPGTHKVKITVHAKGSKRKIVKTVTFKVRRDLSKEVKGLATVTVYCGNSFNYRKGITYNKSRVKSYSVDASKVHLEKLGTYNAKYTIKGISGETVTVKRTIKVVNNPSVASKEIHNRIMDNVEGLVDRAFLVGSKNISLWYGVNANSTVRSVTLDADNITEAPDPRSANPFSSKKITYTVVFKDGQSGKISNTIYFVDLDTGEELVNHGIEVYMDNMDTLPVDINLLENYTIRVGTYVFEQDAKDVYVCSKCGRCFGKVQEFNEHIQGSLDGGSLIAKKVPKLSIVCPFKLIPKTLIIIRGRLANEM